MVLLLPYIVTWTYQVTQFALQAGLLQKQLLNEFKKSDSVIQLTIAVA